MKIKNITLSNFRCFHNIKMDFHDKLTVIVARNGQGKTSFLDAVTVALGTFVGAFGLGKAKRFSSSDARYLQQLDTSISEQQYPVMVEADMAEPTMHLLRKLTGKKSGTTVKDANEMTEYGKKLMQKITEQQSVTLPVIAYYGSGRLWSTHKNMERKAVITESRTMGYENCLSSASNFKQIQQWLNKAAYAVIQQKEMPEYSNYALPQQVAGIKAAVNQVLAGEDWSNFHYSMSHEELALFHPQQGILPVSILSDGVRAMVSLTADLAWRCAKLNPHLKEQAYQETQGIVLIDEVDIHLYPVWQQKVIPSLQKTFPDIQFIVTTHSPQVLSTVESDCIRIVSDGEVYCSSKGTKGAEASRILKRIFGAELRPPEDDNTKLLNTYLDRVYNDQWSLPETQEMRLQLDEIYADEEPALTEADLYIENKSWELSLEKN